MIEKFKDWLIEDGKSANTVRSYILNVEQYMRWYRETFGSEMTALMHSNILDYRSYLQNIKKQQATTINSKLAALVSLNTYLTEAGLQQDHVISKKDFLKIQRSYASPSELNERDVDAFRQTVLLSSGIRDHTIVTIMAYAGLRISETLELTITDMDCISSEITVTKGKGNKRRVVFIGDKVIHAVKEYLSHRESSSEWMFPGRDDGHLHRSVVNKIFNRYSETVTPHKLRHFYCSNALEKGYSIHELANQAGHANIHTTLLYTNPARAVMKGKANKL